MTDEEAHLRSFWRQPRTPCVCRRCAPKLYPPESHGPLRGEGHVTLRFGRRPEHRVTSVSFDGVMTDLCVEAYVPDVVRGDGWIVTGRWERPHHICQHLCDATGHLEACETLRYGQVTIYREL